MEPSRKHKILKFSSAGLSEAHDSLAVEARLGIAINGKEVVSLYCTPTMIRELAVGMILTEGLADELCTEGMKVMYGDGGVTVDLVSHGEVAAGEAVRTSGCVGGLSYGSRGTGDASADTLSVDASALTAMFDGFHRSSELFKETGSVHSAAIARGAEITAFAEDIGRHNAVDKCIGRMILDGMDFKGTVMMASGRLSSDMVGKCARWAIPLVVSRSAPTSLAIDMAEKSGITLVGFLRGRRFNVYTHAHRIRA